MNNGVQKELRTILTSSISEEQKETQVKLLELRHRSHEIEIGKVYSCYQTGKSVESCFKDLEAGYRQVHGPLVYGYNVGAGIAPSLPVPLVAGDLEGGIGVENYYAHASLTGQVGLAAVIPPIFSFYLGARANLDPIRISHQLRGGFFGQYIYDISIFQLGDRDGRSLQFAGGGIEISNRNGWFVPNFTVFRLGYLTELKSSDSPEEPVYNGVWAMTIGAQGFQR